VNRTTTEVHGLINPKDHLLLLFLFFAFHLSLPPPHLFIINSNNETTTFHGLGLLLMTIHDHNAQGHVEAQ
jgi:hypothetical protein